ncbi:hypothetical protein L218DRAFT_960023 [Marasmius fiardii PR-910]|nr:hypothetical protein L218DRAFT_960023 [Marasmius fiardii PR-910]
MWKPQRTPKSQKPIKIKVPKLKQKLAKPPPEKYIVVVNLWRYISSPDFFMMMGGWLQCAFGVQPLAIYYNGNKAEFIIVEFPSNVDVRSRLGAHHPSEFLKDAVWTKISKTVKSDASVIYEYNYPVHKDPDIKFNKNLNEWPDPFCAASPFKWGTDYPPSRLPHTFLSVANDYYALPLPREILNTLRPRLLPPAKPPSPGHDQRSERNPRASLGANPPTTKLESDETNERSLSRSQVGTRTQSAHGKIGKLDPYEEEDNANALLHSPFSAEVKTEPDVEQNVSIKSEDGVSSRRESIGNASAFHVKVKEEAVEGDGSTVSAGLRVAYDEFMAVKVEIGQDGRRPQTLRPERSDRYIKHQPRDEGVSGTGRMRSIKREEEERKFLGDFSREKVDPRGRRWPDPNHEQLREVDKKEEEKESRIRDFPARVKLEHRNDDRRRLSDVEPPRHGYHVKREPSSPRDSIMKKSEEERKPDISGPCEKRSQQSWRVRERDLDAVFGGFPVKPGQFSNKGSHRAANSYSQNSRSGNIVSSSGSVKREYDDFSCNRGGDPTQLWSNKDREGGTWKRRKREF